MGPLTVSDLEDGLAFGARIRGVNHESLKDANVREQLRSIFENRGMIVFEDMEPSSAMQVELSEVFGPLKDHPVPSVARADEDNLLGVIRIASGPGQCIVEIDGKPLVTWQPWHFDHSYNNELNRAGVLRAITIAKDGGRTAFADGIQIYNDMDPTIREKADGLEVLYNLDLRFTEQRFGLPENFKQLRPHDSDLHVVTANNPCAVHPAVWQRDTGEKVFHMSPYGNRGLNGDRSQEAFDRMSEIWVEAERVMKPYYHEWRESDMVIWDNWRMLHEACGSNPDEDRIMHRTTIKGDYGLGRFEGFT